MVTEYRRLLEVPKQTFFLLGVRGIGKTTWVRKGFKQAPLTYNLLDETLFTDLLQDRSRFYTELSGLAPGTWVVVDEVQRIPGLLNECHRLIEERRLRFALLGSSARKLRRAGTNLLGGRALALELFPLTPEELGADFNLDRYLTIGGIPLVVAAEDPLQQLRAYVHTYLREEVQQEALVRNLEGFVRFLPIAGLFHGQVLNVEALSRDAGVARTSVQGYLEILEDTLLAFRLPAFEGRLRVKEKRHPKFYWIDPALARAVKKQFGPPTPEERGFLFEGFVIQLVRTYQSLRQDLYDEMYYWASGRKDSAVEIDLVLTRPKEVLAIEIKSAPKFQNTWLKGLVAAEGLKGIARRILVYPGTRSFTLDSGIEVLTVTDFWKLLSLGKL